MEYIQLKKDSIFRLGIKNQNGEIKKDEKGNEVCLEIDIEDIEAPLRYSKSEYTIRKAEQALKMKLIAIDKKPESNGKYLLSPKDEEKHKALKEYYKSLEEAIDLFLGKNSTNKIFGDRRYWGMWEDLQELIKPYLPKMKANYEAITNKIIGKYRDKENDVLKDE